MCSLRIVANTVAFLCVILSTARANEPDGFKKTIPAADGLPLVCESHGDGDTAILFLHGFCGDRQYWKHQAAPFSTRYRVIAIDQAGHGESGKGRKNWSVAGLGADVEAVVKSLGLKRVILVGHSMGGSVALHAAKRLPGTVVAVIGVDTLHNAEVSMPADRANQFADSFEKDFKGTVRSMLNGIVGTNTDASVKQWLQSKAEAQDKTMAVALMRDFGKIDAKALLREAKVPVRCINSGGGFPSFRPTAVDVNRKYADFQAVLISDVGHYPMLEKPEEFNAKLGEVLTEFTAK